MPRRKKPMSKRPRGTAPEEPPKPKEFLRIPEEPRLWLHPAVREVYRDEFLWVLDKPSGILSHPNPPASRAENGILRVPYDFEEEAYRLQAGSAKGPAVYLIHRLDQETSGLILCAFDPETAAKLKEAIYRREVEKEYRALVVGIPRPERGEWSDRLEKESRGGKLVVRARAGPPNASAEYALVRAFPASGLALLSLRPRTGRTHQLRVQAARRGLPIAGDERYGDFRANRFLASEIGLKRMFLHASRLEIRHPKKRHFLRLMAPLPPNLSAPLERAGKLSSPVPRRTKT